MLFRQTGEDRPVCEAVRQTPEGLLAQARSHLRQAEVEQAAEVAAQALEVAVAGQNAKAQVESLLVMFQAYFVKGDELTARDMALGALQVARRAEKPGLAEEAQEAILRLYAGSLHLQPLLACIRHPALEVR